MLPDWFNLSRLPDWFDLSMLPADFDPSAFPPDFNMDMFLAYLEQLRQQQDSTESSSGETSDNQNGSGFFVSQTETTQIYLVPFRLTPRKPLETTPVKETTRSNYAYITSVNNDKVTSANTAPQKDTPYTGERTASVAAACTAVFALMTALLFRKKH